MSPGATLPLVVGYCTAMATPILSIDDLPAVDGLRARLEPVGDLDRLGGAWRALEPHSEPSFFRSWGWIGCWLRHLPPSRQPLAVMATKGAELVGLGVFVPVRQRRHWLAPARTLRLHESGEPTFDSLFIEHNGLVAKGADASAVWAAMLGLLGRGGAWDEVVLGGMEGHTAEASIEAARAQGCPVMVCAHRRAAHLDLAALRRSKRRLADTLSRNTRHQLMRTRRLYGAIGPVTLRAARSVDEALAMLEQLKALHQRSWHRRGQPGCFAAPLFETFHRDLISDRFRHGEIQLLRAAAGAQAIG
jgi:CelD/BcsL family acetyltransferase involved in cellulose biosynthesis